MLDAKGRHLQWIKLPNEVAVRNLVMPAANAGIICNSGPERAVSAEHSKSHLRLYFATPSKQTIRDGVAVLAKVCYEQTGIPLWSGNIRRISQQYQHGFYAYLTKGTFEALDHGADAAVLLSTEGYLSEGAGFNIWIVRGNALVTPGDNLLEGITRRTVFDLAQEMGIEAKAAKLRPNELMQANEAFLYTTAGAVIPVTRVNDRPLGNGAAGLMTTTLRTRYWERRRAGWHGTSIDSLLNPTS